MTKLHARETEATVWEAACDTCDASFPYPKFLSEGFYEIGTYFGATTGAVYLVSLERVKYGTETLDEVLAPAFELEGGKTNVVSAETYRPCPVCFKGRSLPLLGLGKEGKVLACSLPYSEAAAEMDQWVEDT